MRCEPVAIIGMSCRFPQCDSVGAFWELLSGGRDAVGLVPASRWCADAFYDPDPLAAAKTNTRCGGFMEQVEGFDAGFFSIAPREALNMDPQQRILLECAWEALEDALIVPSTLRGSRTGCFIGVASFDYYERILESTDRIDSYTMTGNAYSIAANRLSYVFDLRGPSVSVDTACSSSLVSVHLACQSLLSGECDLALAGGVHVMAAPWVSVAASKGQFLSPDGRCKAFGASADGYGRGEGSGVLILKTLRSALEAGDRVWAVIRASAVNQDGRSNGMTAPNPGAQTALLEEVYRRAGIGADALGYIEAHGTGTRLGDPIEANALGQFLRSQGYRGRCLIGSVKSNFGHLEAAAGIAGLVKAVLAVHKGLVPPTLHTDPVNPLIDLKTLPLALPAQLSPWPLPGRRYAGVSSFGFGGTNSHVVLEEAEQRETPVSAAAEAMTADILLLSAKSAAALADLAKRYGVQFRQAWRSAALVRAVCRSASLGRAHFACRAAIDAAEPDEFASTLEALAAGMPAAAGLSTAAISGRPNKRQHRCAFLFSGQGSHYAGMGSQLYASEPVFADTIDRCQQIFSRLGLTVPLSVVFSDTAESAHALSSASNLQPAQFALQAALTELLRSWGVQPSIVLGHSIGEYAACYAAGVMSLETAATLVAHRGALTQQLAAKGRMCSVFSDAATTEACVSGYCGRVVIAAFNGPSSVVISGAAADVLSAAERLTADGIKCVHLDVSHGFHSPLMAGVLPAYRKIVERESLSRPTVPFISTVTGELADTQLLTPEYWCRQIELPVRLDEALRTLAGLGVDSVVEIGPRATLLAHAAGTLSEVALIPTLAPQIPERLGILRALGRLYCEGAEVRHADSSSRMPCPRVDLPHYPFQRTRYWAPDGALTSWSAVDSRQVVGSSHPLLKKARWGRLGSGEIRVDLQLDLKTAPYLADHKFNGTTVLAGTAYVEVAHAVAHQVLATAGLEVCDIRFRQPVFLQETPRTLQLMLNENDASSYSFRFLSAAARGTAGDALVLHASGKLRRRHEARE